MKDGDGASAWTWTPLQRGGSHGGGNELYLAEWPGGRALLKVYRRRGGALREAVKRLSQPFEGRHGVTAEERCTLERETLLLWRENGIDVPAVLDLPLPEGLDARTACWMEYCPGRSFARLLHDRAVPDEEKVRIAGEIGRIAGRRHALAFERRDVRFLVENASVKHVLVCDARLVHFDLENGFQRRSDPLDALARELSTTLRSLQLHGFGLFEDLATAWARAHPRPELLRRAAELGAFSRDPRQRMRRWLDRRERRPGTAKADMLSWLADALSDVPTPERAARGVQPELRPGAP